MIGKATLRRVRKLYKNRWSRDWPFDDDYLVTLVEEAKGLLNLAKNARHRYDEVYEETLTLMRADHEFTNKPQ